MKINTKIRIRAINRLIERLEIEDESISPFGFNSKRSYEIYLIIEYYENILNVLTRKK